MEHMDNGTVLGVRRGAELYAECSAEYILPDYKGDVKRVLHTEARALPSGSFTDGNQAELGGVVVFNVLYLDSENGLASVEFTGDYSLSAPTRSGETISAVLDAQNVSIRLPGPRKMNAKCTVRARAENRGEMSCAATGSAFDGDAAPQTCTAKVRTARILSGEMHDREYAQELFFAPGAALDDVQIIARRADAKISSVAVRDGEAAVSGEISILALAALADAAPCVKETRIPFDERVELEGAEEGMDGLAHARISSLECSMNPTDDGVRVNVSVISDIEVTAYGNDEVYVVTDAYSTAAEVENEYESMAYEEFCGARISVAKVAKDVPKAETDAARASDVLYMSTDTKILSVSTASSVVSISGEVRFSGVACEICDDGTPMYTPIKFSVPFNENVNFNGQIPSEATVECDATGSDGRMTLDENNFYAECTLSLTANVFARKEMTRLLTCNVISEAANVRGANVISVYYPDEGDTLFEVAKRFKTSVSKIAEDNSLTAEAARAQTAPLSLAGVEKLIIKYM